MNSRKPPDFELRRVPVFRPRSEPALYRVVPDGARWPMTRHEFLRGSLAGVGGVAGALAVGCGGGGGGGGGASGGGTGPTCPAPSTAALDEAGYLAHTRANVRAHASRVNILAFSVDGRTLASAGGSGGTAGNGNRDHTEIKLWSMPTGKLFANIADDLPTSGLKFSDDNTQFFASTSAGFHTWTVNPTNLVGSITGPAGAAFVARNGAVKTAGILIGVSSVVRLAAWNLASGAKLFDVSDPLPAGKEPYNTAMNDASTVMAVAFVDGDIELREATGSRLLLRTLDAAAERPAMVFSPDGRLFASAGGLTYASSALNPSHGDTAISLWDVASGVLLRRLVGHANRVNALAFNADGSLLVSGSGGNSSSAGLPSFVDPGNNPFPNAADENSVRVWNTANGTPRQAFTGLGWRINAVAISPDGRHVAAGSQDNTIKVWDTLDGSFVAGLFDASALEPDRTANYVGTALPNASPVQRAYPTSAALPAAATCTCNCVAGSYVPKPPAGGGGPCALVCVCVPVTFPGF